MALKIVSKRTYNFVTLLFYSLCLKGLIWQVVEISIHYFKFDVIKDINVFTPEESKLVDKILNICIRNHEIFNHSELLNPLPKLSETDDMLNYYGQSMTFGYRFNVTISSRNIFDVEPIGEFIVSYGYCFRYQVDKWIDVDKDMAVNIDRDMLKNVTKVFVSFGRAEYPFDVDRLISIKQEWINSSKEYRIKSNLFDILKLEWPYTDDCFNYTTDGFTDRRDSISNCSSNKTHISPYKIISKGSYQYRDKYLGPYIKAIPCFKRIYNLNCDYKLYLTQIDSVSDYENEGNIAIRAIYDSDASFSVYSQPRIDHISYVTYILGAMGSWIGFSFIGINPIPYFISFHGAAATNEIQGCLCCVCVSFVTV